MSKVKNYVHYLGIDVSKKTLDITVLNQKCEVQFYEQIQNNEKDIKKFIVKLKKEKLNMSDCLFCAEYTGIYNKPLQNILTALSIDLWMEKPMQIKRTMGMVRGKTDKIDSLRIAQYAYKNKVDLRLWQPIRKPVELLKTLSSVRSRLVKTKRQLTQGFTEEKFYSKEIKNAIQASCKKSIQGISTDIIAVEKQMNQIIKEDVGLKRLYTIITSVDGVGMHSAIEVIITTNEFKNISEPKKYACYSGVVPFEYSSGSSIKKRAKVSKMANTSVKTLLHMSALSVINMEGDMKKYFERKVAEGKNKMSVINAIRNKLILRIFACVNNNRLYQKKYQYELV